MSKKILNNDFSCSLRPQAQDEKLYLQSFRCRDYFEKQERDNTKELVEEAKRQEENEKLFYKRHKTRSEKREEAMMESLLESTIQVCACVFVIFIEIN